MVSRRDDSTILGQVEFVSSLFASNSRFISIIRDDKRRFRDVNGVRNSYFTGWSLISDVVGDSNSSLSSLLSPVELIGGLCAYVYVFFCRVYACGKRSGWCCKRKKRKILPELNVWFWVEFYLLWLSCICFHFGLFLINFIAFRFIVVLFNSDVSFVLNKITITIIIRIFWLFERLTLIEISLVLHFYGSIRIVFVLCCLSLMRLVWINSIVLLFLLITRSLSRLITIIILTTW